MYQLGRLIPRAEVRAQAHASCVSPLAWARTHSQRPFRAWVIVKKGFGSTKSCLKNSDEFWPITSKTNQNKNDKILKLSIKTQNSIIFFNELQTHETTSSIKRPLIQKTCNYFFVKKKLYSFFFNLIHFMFLKI